MRFRKLRIAWSVGWGLVAVLLCLLWNRDYREAWPRFAGVIVSPKDYDLFHTPIQRLSDPPRPKPTLTLVYKNWYEFKAAGTPYVGIVVGSIISGAAPWAGMLRYRFSLRALLIATTLVAAVLGCVVYFAR